MKRTLITLMVLLGFTLPAVPQEQLDKYLLLSTNRTGTMQREMNEAPPEYDFVGMTVFSSTFGGKEVAVILEAEITDSTQ